MLAGRWSEYQQFAYCDRLLVSVVLKRTECKH